MTESAKQINVNYFDRMRFFDDGTNLDQLKSFTRKKYVDNLACRSPANTLEAVSMPCRIIFFILLLGLLESCAVNAPTESDSTAKPSFDYTGHELFGTRPEIILPQSLHDLTPAQYRAFDEYFNAPVNRKHSPNRRLYNYLEQSTPEFSYLAETLTATEALEQQQGNCMSLAMLTTALANRANIKIEYQLMDDTPVFEQGKNVIMKGVHVRTKLLSGIAEPEKNVKYFLKPGIIVDYFPNGTSRFVGNLSESEYVSGYYLNKAANAIDSADFNLAYWLVMEALALNDTSASAFNMLAVIYKKVGEINKAEAVYQYGIASLPTPLTLLKNYQLLLVEQHRLDEAKLIETKLQQIDDPSPYRWQRLAFLALETGKYRDAVNYYRRAIKHAPYMHELHYQLARAYSHLGQDAESKNQLELAINNTQNAQARAFYELELQAYSSRLKQRGMRQ